MRTQTTSYEAIIIEHGSGINVHEYFVAQVDRYTIEDGRRVCYRQLVETGRRSDLDAAQDEIRDFVKRHGIGSRRVTIKIFHS